MDQRTRQDDQVGGALVDPADRGAFIEYLSVNFPPDKPPGPIAHVARRKKQ